MKRFKIAATAAALMLATAFVVSAQDTGGEPGRGRPEGRGGFGPGGRGGDMGRVLLRGIKLTDQQKDQLKALKEKHRTEMEGYRESGKANREAMRAAREKGDTAAARATFEKVRADMVAIQQRHQAEVRALLTAEQQTTFDANVQEMKARLDEWRERGPGPGEGRGMRGGRPGGPEGGPEGQGGPPGGGRGGRGGRGGGRGQ